MLHRSLFCECPKLRIAENGKAGKAELTTSYSCMHPVKLPAGMAKWFDEELKQAAYVRVGMREDNIEKPIIVA